MAGSAPARRAHLSGLSDAWPLPAGVGLLALLWLGPLPEMSRTAFSAHMILHLGIVAAAAPLLAIGLNRTRYGFANLRPGLKSAAAASLFDRIAPGGTVMLDDGARPGERLVARRWRRLRPDFEFTLLKSGTKGTLVGRKAG